MCCKRKKENKWYWHLSNLSDGDKEHTTFLVKSR